MFARRTFQRLTLVAVLMATQLGGCDEGSYSPVPVQIELEGEATGVMVRRYRFLSRGGFVEYAPVAVRRAGLHGYGPDERAAARRALAQYCSDYRFDLAPIDTTYWTEDGSWHFVRGCQRAR